MGWLSDLVGAVVSVTAAVIGVAVKASSEIVHAAAEAWNDYQERQRRDRLPKAEQVKEHARDELKNVNDELLSLINKYKHRGDLSSNDRARADFLNNRRSELKRTIDGIDEVSVAREINDQPDAFQKFVVDDSRAHILQGQVGVSVFGKKCPNCGRDMLIQWPRSVEQAKVSDFFWGCSGWYHQLPNGARVCSTTMKVSQADMNIFARTDTPEYQVENGQLTELVSLPGPSSIVIERMDDVISEQRSQRRGSADYRCPTHGEELVLRKKNQPTSLLDQYFLGCPRWQPNNQGCGYMVKLKSAAQLSTLLKKETGAGVL
ncbi:MAG: hypothetical protein KC592_19905 [Nitrospira sp.]|nr:hypothetical protein [Nitrospira sp.]